MTSSTAKLSRRFTTGTQWLHARELGCAESLLHRWKRDTVEASSDSEKELIALRKKLREVEMERDILKKAALIFGRSG